MAIFALQESIQVKLDGQVQNFGWDPRSTLHGAPRRPYTHEMTQKMRFWLFSSKVKPGNGKFRLIFGPDVYSSEKNEVQ